MKRVLINQGNVGLVFRNGDYKRVLTAGKHWVSILDSVVKFDMVKPFMAPKTIDLYLGDEKLAGLLNVIRVADTEIVLKYKRGNFREVLTSGTYAYWKGLIDYSFIKVNLADYEIDECIDKEVLIDRALYSYVRKFTIESFEEGLLLVNGKYVRQLDKGTHYFWQNTTALTVLKADMRQVQMEVNGQEILTKDKAALRINFYGQYKVKDIVKALIENKDYEKQLYVLMQIALREFVGRFTLDELLEEKSSLAEYVKEVLKLKSKDLGIEIRDCGVKDIILPGEVKDIMNQVLVAQKQAQANVVTRREETASTRNLLNTAKLMEDNQMLFKLKEMEYVERIAEKVSNISLSGGNKVLDQLKEVFTGFK